MESLIPPAPWTLTGQAVACFAAPFVVRLLVKYESSPVGPYLEHALVRPTLGGPHVFQMSVTLEASRRGGRAIWGFPKTIERLSWHSDGERVTFGRAGQTLRFRAWGPTFPLALPFWTVQNRSGQRVRVPGRIRGRAQLALRGRRWALLLPHFSMLIEPPQFP